MRSTTPARFGLVIAGLAVVATACSTPAAAPSSDSAAAPAPAAAAPAPAASAGGDSAGFCADSKGLLAAAAPKPGDSGQDALKKVADVWSRLAAEAPADIQPDAQTMADTFQGQASGSIAPTAAAAALRPAAQHIQAWGQTHCT